MASSLTAAICDALDAQNITDGGLATPIPGLKIGRVHGRLTPRHMAYQPSLCIVAQGVKEILVGARAISYGDMQSLVVTAEVPVLSQIIEASPERPFVGGTLTLDPDIMYEVAKKLTVTAMEPSEPANGMTVKDIDQHISAAFIRLVELIKTPQAIPLLYPEIMREIAYWLLTGPVAQDVVRWATPKSQPARIAQSIAHLKNNLEGPIQVAELAGIAGMSTSSFHQHFKGLTSMSPLQYHKHMRLLEAKRLMLSEGEKAGVAAGVVGYESVSQFSREYVRMFGVTPGRELTRSSERASLPPVREIPQVTPSVLS